MKIGYPTHPRKDIVDEIRWTAENKFDFVDLFLEADRTEEHTIDVKTVRSAIEEYNLDRIGHTAWYLPIGSPMKALRQEAVEILCRYIVLFNQLNCHKMVVHANWPPGLFGADEGIKFQTESLQALSAFALQHDVKILYEPIGTKHDDKENIRKILALNPEIDFLADLGHLNLFQRDPLDYLIEFKSRLSHIHMHDNDGLRDLHLPIGTGNIDWNELIKQLKTFYDGTITLEIFSPDRDYVLLSKQKLREKWDLSPNFS